MQFQRGPFYCISCITQCGENIMTDLMVNHIKFENKSCFFFFFFKLAFLIRMSSTLLYELEAVFFLFFFFVFVFNLVAQTIKRSESLG